MDNFKNTKLTAARNDFDHGFNEKNGREGVATQNDVLRTWRQVAERKFQRFREGLMGPGQREGYSNARLEKQCAKKSKTRREPGFTGIGRFVI